MNVINVGNSFTRSQLSLIIREHKNTEGRSTKNAIKVVKTFHLKPVSLKIIQHPLGRNPMNVTHMAKPTNYRSSNFITNRETI